MVINLILDRLFEGRMLVGWEQCNVTVDVSTRT